VSPNLRQPQKIYGGKLAWTEGRLIR
jgi:hypothetical protein